MADTHLSAAWLPAPGVRFGAGFAARLGSLALRLGAAVDRREGAGAGFLAGAGAEWAGARPYRPGEDLRRLDWDLLARLDRPFVRVVRREASEEWSVLLETSASMGVAGRAALVPEAAPRGKLQAAAELCAALSAMGLLRGARVRLIDAQSGASLRVTRRAELARALAWLEARRAAGASEAVRALTRLKRSAGARVFLVGDCFGLEPRDFLALARPGRALMALRVLAPLEVEATQLRAIEWIEPHTGARLALRLDAPLLARYEALLATESESWVRGARNHRARFVQLSSASSLETLARQVLDRA